MQNKWRVLCAFCIYYVHHFRYEIVHFCVKKQIQVLTFVMALKIYSLSWVTPVDHNRWAYYKCNIALIYFTDSAY